VPGLAEVEGAAGGVAGGDGGVQVGLEGQQRGASGGRWSDSQVRCTRGICL
jgi:hypothetical protein